MTRRLRMALLIVVAWTAFRAWMASGLELSDAEALLWAAGQGMPGGPARAPLPVWLVEIGTALVGDTELGVRAPGLLAGALAVGAAALVGGDALLVVLALVALPLAAVGGVFAGPEAVLCAAWALGLLAAARGRWLAVGAAGGLATLSGAAGLLLVPLLALAEPAALRTRGPWLALVPVAGALLVAHWTGGLVYLGPVAADPVIVALDILVWVTPVVVGAALAWWAVAWRGDRLDHLCWWSSLPVLGLALTGQPALAAPAWIGVAVGLARRAGPLRRAAWLGVGVAGFASAAAMVHLHRPLLDVPNDPRARLTGGRVLAGSVAAWGVPAVYTAEPADAALIRFYGGLEARPVSEPGEEPVAHCASRLQAGGGGGRTVAESDRSTVGGGPSQEGSPPQKEQRRSLLRLCATGSEPVAHAIFVRPWRGGAAMELARYGYETDGPNDVSSYMDGTDPLAPRVAARWQVFEVRRAASPVDPAL